MSGPAPKPNALKVLDGNPGKRPIGTDPEFTATTPRPPASLKGEALAEWARIVPELEKAGLLTLVDRPALIGFCEQWMIYVAAMDDVRANGILISSRDGYSVVKNPAVQVARDSLDTMNKIGSRFGWTPADRVRLSTFPGKDDPAMPESPQAKALRLLS